MLEVKFYDNVSDDKLAFAVIITKMQEKWVICKKKERNTDLLQAIQQIKGSQYLKLWKCGCFINV